MATDLPLRPAMLSTASPMEHLRKDRLVISALLCVPALRTGVERHIERRAVGVLPDMGEPLVGTGFPRHVALARGYGVEQASGIVVRQRGAAVQRPAAEVDRRLV